MDENIPQHIVVIPDGNRRWAKAHGFPELRGHAAGIDLLQQVAEWCREFKVRTITLWGFSYENFRRDEKQVGGLMGLLERKFEEFRDKSELHKNKIRVRFFGRIGLLPASLQKKLRSVEKETENYDDYHMNILLAYGGHQELVDAINAAIKDAKKGKISKVDEKSFAKYLYLHELPDPDLIIRTSGEMRLSGVLPWNSGYSELYFCPKLWPDFSKEDFKAALDEFARRKRRFGK